MDPTKHVRLGRTSVEVTQLGLGTNPLGGLYEPIPSEVVQATFDACWQQGIRFYDVAPVYGYGFAEREAGTYLRQKTRDEYVLTTKVGRLLMADGDTAREDKMVIWEGSQLYKGTDPVKPYFDFSYDGVMRSVEDSQKRTGIERFDALHIHDPDFYPEEALDGAFKALDQLRSEGTIKAIGCGMNQWEMLAQFARRADFDCFLLAGRYTLLDQSALAELLPICAERGISIINGGVYNSGILAHPDPASLRPVSTMADAIGTWTSNVTYNYIPADQQVIDHVVRIKSICDRHNVPLMAAALQFSLHHPAVASVVMGPRDAAQVISNIEMFRIDIPNDLWAELKHEGELPMEAPTPS